MSNTSISAASAGASVIESSDPEASLTYTDSMPKKSAKAAACG